MHLIFSGFSCIQPSMTSIFYVMSIRFMIEKRDLTLSKKMAREPSVSVNALDQSMSQHLSMNHS